MGIFSGILGAISDIDTVRDWRVSETSSLQSFITSNTKGMTGVCKGNVDWSGSYNAYGHTPPKMPGEIITFLGSMDGVKGVSGQAIIDSVEMSIDIEGGGIISYSAAFSGDGALSKGVAAAISDTKDPAAYSAVGRKVEIAAPAGTPSFAALPDVRTATLRFTANNQSYASSNTNGTIRRLPGNLSASLSLTMYASSNDLANLLSIMPNTLKIVRVYVDATTFWEFDAVLFESITDLTIDRENAAVVGFTANAQFTGFYQRDTSWITGKITKPSEDIWWPPAGA
ncbi:MAG TPA: hypothetical protein PLP49_10910 [Anaerohalosphaeraceae bacterium]|nr:hypothetical protein [Anaerohalosphaeraceae bacterium]